MKHRKNLRLTTIMRSLCKIVLAVGLVSSCLAQAQQLDSNQLPEGLYQIGTDPMFSNVAFVVDKSKRSLKVYSTDDKDDLKQIAEYPADIGKSDGNKIRSGDAKTPEGIYFLLNKLTSPSLDYSQYGSLAFTTDYPNVFDRREDKTGSGIWLHAIPDTVPLTRGSKGCVVVRDEVIKKLGNLVKLNETPILIFDQVRYVPADAHRDQRNKLLSFVENWKKDWESQDLDKYMAHYDETFKTKGYNFRQWFTHKRSLKEQYKYVKVQLSSPVILQNKNYLILKALQKYESDLHVDFGEKTIYAKITDKGIKIVREDWRPLPERSLLTAGQDKNKTADNSEIHN